MLFLILPDVKSFCFCMTLKRGTLITAVFYMLLTGFNLTMSVLGEESQFCYKGVNNKLCQFSEVWKYLKYVQMYSLLFVFVISALLILGVFVQSHKVVSVFMYILTITVVLDFLIDAYIFWLLDPIPHCGLHSEIRVLCICAEIALKILFFYLLVVVKSYRSELVKHQHPRRRWRSALSLISGGLSDRDRRYHMRKGSRVVESKSLTHPGGSSVHFSEASGSKSRSDENSTPANKRVFNEGTDDTAHGTRTVDENLDTTDAPKTDKDTKNSPI